MPTHMRNRFTPAELADIELAEPFDFTKGVRPLRLPARAQMSPYAFGTLLFDLAEDPGQQHPLDDADVELRMLRLLARLMHENDAPASQFERLGIPFDGEPGPEHLLVREQAGLAAMAAAPLPPLDAFPSGDFDLSTPLPELLAHPRARHVLDTHLPQLTQSELVSMLGDTSIYQLAATVTVPEPVLRGVARELATI